MSGSVRSALFISVVLTNGITALQFGASLILARLLSPKEIGVYSVAAAIVAMAQLFRNVGITNYLVGVDVLNSDRIRSAFGVQIVTSWTLCLIVIASANPVAFFYGEPGVRNVILVASVSFLLAPFGGITTSVLLREMKHRQRAVIDISGALAHALVGISLAYQGFGYMSLAWAGLSNTITTVLVSMCFRPTGLPWTPRFRGIRNVLKFSLPTAGADILRYGRTVLPELVAGKIIGFDAVAYLSRANGLVGLFYASIGQAVARVALAFFPHEKRAGGNLRNLYLKANSYLCATAWPFFATLAILADPVVAVLFGSQWHASVPIVQILATSAAISTPFSLTSQALNALGETRAIFSIDSKVFVLTGCAVVPAAFVDTMSVAVAIAVVATAYAYLCVRELNRTLGIRLRDLLESARAPLAVALTTAVPPALVTHFAYFSQPLALLFFGGLAASVGWGIGIFTFKPPIHAELNRFRKLQ